MAIDNVVPKFSNGDLKTIAGSLPESFSNQQQKLLQRILHEWSRTDLREHLSWEGRMAATPDRINRLTKIAKYAREMLHELNEIDHRGSRRIAIEIIHSERVSDIFSISQSEIMNVADQLGKTRDFLAKLAALKPRVIFGIKAGRHRNIPAYLILQDAAAIFEWYSGQEATRQVDRDTGKETGPFWRFASALWAILFGSAQGLPAAMKNWAYGKLHFHERSPLIANMALRHSSWGIYSR